MFGQLGQGERPGRGRPCSSFGTTELAWRAVGGAANKGEAAFDNGVYSGKSATRNPKSVLR